MGSRLWTLSRAIFLGCVVVCIAATGWLLHLLHKDTIQSQQNDIVYSMIFNLVDELRNDTRALSGLAHRATASIVNEESEKEFTLIRGRRQGLVPRSVETQVAPGRQIAFATLLSELPLTVAEKNLLLQAYAKAEVMAEVEQEVIRIAAPLDIDDLVDENARETVRYALQLLKTKHYLDNEAAVQLYLTTLIKNLSQRMNEDGVKLRQRISTRTMLLCLFFFCTVGGLLVFVHLNRMKAEWADRRGNYRRTYLCLVGLLALALIVPMMFVYHDARRHMVEALEKRQALIANEVYNELRLRARQALELAGIIGSRPPVRHYLELLDRGYNDPAAYLAAMEVVDSFSAGYSDHAHTLLLDKTGKLRGSTLSDLPLNTQILHQEMLDRVMQGESFITVLPSYTSSGEDEMVTVAPIYEDSNKRLAIQGAVLSILDRKNSFRLWEGRLAAEENMNIFILNRDAVVILSSLGLHRQGKPAAGGGAALVREGASGLQYFKDAQGVERIGYFMPLQSLGWTVGVTSSYANIMANVQDMFVRAGLFGTAAGLVLIMLFTLLMQRMSRSLRLAHEHLIQLIHHADMFSWEMDIRAKTFSFDAHLLDLLEYPGPRLPGAWSLEEHMSRHHPDNALRPDTMWNTLGKGNFFHYEVRYRSYTDKWLWLRIIASVDACDKQGLPTLISGVGMNITAQKTVEDSEAALKDAHQRIHDIIESADIFTFDVDFRAGVFTHNATWCRIWRWEGPEEDGEKPLSLFTASLTPASLETFNHLFRTTAVGEVFSADFEVRICNGEQRWLRHRGRIVERDADGQLLRVIGTGFDITAQKTLEEKELSYREQLEEMVAQRTSELEESRRQAEAASQAKSVFLSTVSHEIRTPMNAIVGFAHLFDRSNLSETQKEQLRKIKLAATTLLSVINDVLDISKIEAGKLELEQTSFAVRNMLDTVCSIVSFAALEKGLSLNVDVAPEVPDLLAGDPKRIGQILLNLMNNAVKFTSKGGISLNVGLADKQAQNDDGDDAIMLAVSVADTGIGLSEEQMERLFKPFMQADSSVTRRFGGTGLGLAISKQLVELMGGKIGVRSQQGTGSVFHCTLCLAAPDTSSDLAELPLAPDNSAHAELSGVQALANKRALVVEDNEINQEIAKALLAEYGIDADVADNGLASLEAVVHQHYDCIFMDMQMPVMGGIEAARCLRDMGKKALESEGQEAPLAWLLHVPIVAMTANAMAEDRQRCLEAGMNDHIGKPIDMPALHACLMRWLGGQS